MNLSLVTRFIKSGLTVILLTGILLAGVGQSNARAAGIVRYATTTGLTSGNCENWAKACTLTYALSKAVSGDQIWLKKGTYKPHATNRAISFVLKSGVAVYGGFTGTETALSKRNPAVNVTILSGEINAANTNNDNSYHVVVASGTNSHTALDGVTITEGKASGPATSDKRGGGMYNDGGSPKLNNVIFLENAASTQGGGMYNVGGGAPKLTYITFDSNSASTNTVGGPGRGGGMYNASSSPTLTNVIFLGNSADSGGGLFNASGSSPTLALITFKTNDGYDGGGMFNLASSPTLKNMTFKGNTSLRGGGIFNGSGSAPAITNVTLSGNSATTDGGGMYNASSNPTLTNVIVWGNNSTSGEDEVFDGASTPVIKNSVVRGGCPTGATCSSLVTTDPLLLPLADNGGFTQTMALGNGSPAVDAGLDAGCPSTDQRGVTRPIGMHCDIGAVESTDLPTSVVSITRAENYSNPTSARNVGFVVTFSQDVTGVDVNDFELTTTGTIAGATIVSVNGSGAVYGVIVNTGTGSGTLRLDIPITATILDLSGDPLTNLPFTTGEIYMIEKSITFLSSGAQDGWILESGQLTNAGGTMDNVAATLRVGDESDLKQYRSVLSFDTSALPDDALITRVILKIKYQAVSGANPISALGGFLADVNFGPFNSAALQLTDFQAASNKTVGPLTPALASGWYSLNLSNAKGYVNQAMNGSGLTQIRLRFLLDDNNDAVADFLSVYSGDAAQTDRPRLIVEFYIP